MTQLISKSEVKKQSTRSYVIIRARLSFKEASVNQVYILVRHHIKICNCEDVLI